MFFQPQRPPRDLRDKIKSRRAQDLRYKLESKGLQRQVQDNDLERPQDAADAPRASTSGQERSGTSSRQESEPYYLRASSPKRKRPATSNPCKSPPRKIRESRSKSPPRELSETSVPGTRGSEGETPKARIQESWKFKCLLANMGTNKKSSKKSGQPDLPQSEGNNKTLARYKILQPIIDSHPDVMFLQEVESIQAFLKKHKSQYHQTYSPEKVATLLRKRTVGAVEIYTIAHLKQLLRQANLHEVLVKLVKEGHWRISFMKAVPIGKQDGILMVSYHARNFSNTSARSKKKISARKSSNTPTQSKEKISVAKYHEIDPQLLKICQHIQRKVGAKHLLIGGDFNFSVKTFEQLTGDTLTVHKQNENYR